MDQIEDLVKLVDILRLNKKEIISNIDGENDRQKFTYSSDDEQEG